MKTPCRLALLLLAAGLGLSGHAAETQSPLTFEEAKATALRNHPQVTIAHLRALVAEEFLKQNQAAYFPTLDAYMDAVDTGNRNTRILAGALNNPVIYDRVADGLGVDQLITDFGLTKNLVASARFAAKAETENAVAVNEQILLNLEVNYFNTLQTEAVLGVAQATTKARELLVNQVTALARNQLKSDLDVSFAAVALEQSRLLLQKAVGDAGGAQANLAAALGYRRPRHFVLQDTPLTTSAVPTADELIDEAMKYRPGLIRLRYEQESAERFARAQKDHNYPTVAAVGEVGNALSHDYRLPNKYAAGGVVVTIPLFEGGAYVARQHEAELKADIAAQAVRDEEDTVSRDVQLALLNYTTSVQRLRTTEELLRHSNQAYSLAQARYKIGSSSIVELTDAQVAATSAQIAEASARYDELIQRAIVDYQVGALR